MALQQPELLRGTLCQWLSWHPAEVVGLESGDLAGGLGFGIESVRFQTAEDLTNLPPAAVDLEVLFFEDSAAIAAVALYRETRFPQAMMETMMKELCRGAEQFVANPHVPIM